MYLVMILINHLLAQKHLERIITFQAEAFQGSSLMVVALTICIGATSSPREHGKMLKTDGISTEQGLCSKI